MKPLLIAILAFALTSPVFAADFSSDTGSDTKQSKEQSLSQKNNREQKASSSHKKSKSRSTGRDKTASRSAKESGTVGANEGLDLGLPAQALFTLPGMVYLLPADFGWTGQIPGGVNTTTAEYYHQRATSNATLEPEEQEQVRAYLCQVAEAGALVGQAMINLQKDIPRIGRLTRDNKGNIEVRGIGADDLQTLATGAMRQAEKMNDKRIRSQLDRILTDETTCRYQGDVTRIQCGRAFLDLASPPVLKIDGVEWYGAAFAGLSGSYKVASSWSWSKALEDAQNDSRFSKYAAEVAETAEKMEAEGKSFEAVQARKKAIEQMKANKAGMSPGKFLPGVH